MLWLVRYNAQLYIYTVYQAMRNFSLFRELKLSHITAGFIAVLVGYTSSVAIIFQAADAAGASQSQINSWLLVLGIGMGVTCIALSLKYKAPILTAWSTPGAAILATSLNGTSINEAMGAFIITGFLITITGVTGWFEKISRVIPQAISAAMLAGILFQFGVELFLALENQFLLVGLMAITYLVGKQFFPRYVIPVVLCIGIFVSWQLNLFATQSVSLEIALPEWVNPQFSVTTLISIAIPLFIVTMTSQNMPGVAAINASGYKVPISPIITTTGVTTLLLAPFGGFAFNLAAITAAICMGPEAGENKKSRYLAAVSAGIFYLIVGLFGATVVALFAISPKELVLSVAGLALLGTIGSSLSSALVEEKTKEAAIITFILTASGISLCGIGAAFWGLLAGVCVSFILNFSNQCSSNAQ